MIIRVSAVVEDTPSPSLALLPNRYLWIGFRAPWNR